MNQQDSYDMDRNARRLAEQEEQPSKWAVVGVIVVIMLTGLVWS